MIATTTDRRQWHYYFDDLPPGTYGVHEIQPIGYFDGGTYVGSAGGDKIRRPDHRRRARLRHERGDYNFCEIPPAKLCGYVYVDTNNNGIRGCGRSGYRRRDAVPDGRQRRAHRATVVTDANGYYCFIDLRPGTYGVGEVQPPGYFDGQDTPGHRGRHGGNPGDTITDVVLHAGRARRYYNFGELPPASISGRVHVNTTGDCEIRRIRRCRRHDPACWMPMAT